MPTLPHFVEMVAQNTVMIRRVQISAFENRWVCLLRLNPPLYCGTADELSNCRQSRTRATFAIHCALIVTVQKRKAVLCDRVSPIFW